ncbi:MMPL family transporter [Pseudomaricurvus alkylphenolicus]|uniref:efflux RND transporter permease subunit n=1 Tax=Pseudomaricurvus alkylphenolicus TaxID=1306991 RepID=UPI00141E8E9A|nr:MMPL family transporter [Pseudomaricurvus alkylphenolicus]NIB42265.1 MMPL family transporter [Pseudomaricurvus alkylphenolicus]
MKRLHQFTHFLRNLDNYVFHYPKLFLGLIALATVFFAMQVPKVQMYSDFADLLPQEHPYIKLHNSIRDTFGGANNVVMAVEVEEGDIFTSETLARIHRVTQSVDNLTGVNHNLLSSLTHRTSRKVWLTETGDVNSEPYYDPTQLELTPAQLAGLRNDVMANPRVYGLLVSPDLKAALIKAQFNEGQLDYEKIFTGIQEIRAAESVPGTKVYATGQPMLWGWVYSYLDQIFLIFSTTAAIMLALLVVYFRRAYGIILPLFGITISCIWGVGIVSLLGYNLDPLTLVIPFLIAARAMSHGIQLVQRYYDEFDLVGDGREAAQRTFDSLFRPGTLGIVSDAIGLLLIALGSVPINVKLGIYASLWAVCVVLTVLVTVPLLLSLLPAPKVAENRARQTRGWIHSVARIVSSRRGGLTVLALAFVTLLAGGALSSRVQIGESEPGSPILYLDHDYNVSSKVINERFPGSEELYIVARTENVGGMKRPEVLRAIAAFQRHMMMDPELGGTKALPGLVKQVNRIFHSDDPRWAVIPDTDSYVGGLMFAYMASSPIPGALKEFVDTDDQVANIVFFYKDHQAKTIRRAIHQAKAWIEDPANHVDGLTIELAGGLVGVTAAMNESAFESNMTIIPLVLAFIFFVVTWFYWSFHAGWLMLLAMAFCTTSTYAYMGLANIGINVNTVPIIAVGIGVGIDYSIYMMDRIREEVARSDGDMSQALIRALSSTGKAIAFTATCLIGGVIMWVFLSDLRFQADAALLLVVMLVLNALAAVFLVPAWIGFFKPDFITRARFDEDGVLQTDLEAATA